MSVRVVIPTFDSNGERIYLEIITTKEQVFITVVDLQDAVEYALRDYMDEDGDILWPDPEITEHIMQKAGLSAALDARQALQKIIHPIKSIRQDIFEHSHSGCMSCRQYMNENPNFFIGNVNEREHSDVISYAIDHNMIE